MYKVENTDIFDLLYDDELMDTGQVPAGSGMTPKDALVLSLNHFGKVNLTYMSQITACPVQDLVKDMEGILIWKDPRSFDPSCPSQGWLTRDQLCNYI